MNRRERQALDDHITGHGGEDQLRRCRALDIPHVAHWLLAYRAVLVSDADPRLKAATRASMVHAVRAEYRERHGRA